MSRHQGLDLTDGSFDLADGFLQDVQRTVHFRTRAMFSALGRSAIWSWMLVILMGGHLHAEKVAATIPHGYVGVNRRSEDAPGAGYF
jgi:hypothetical protein